MHSLMMVAAVAVAVGLRAGYVKCLGSWQERWQHALSSFLLPPLLMFVTAISVVWMGRQGVMLGFQTGWLSYGASVLFLGWAIAWVTILLYQGIHACRKLMSCPQVLVSQEPVVVARVLESPQIFAARVGFWKTELVITQGMLDTFDREHLNAVLKHEEAHAFFHDTFWFFWLSYIRQITMWLPHTEGLWQELLLLRELRADRWAIQYVDNLALAESLLWSVASAPQFSRVMFTALSDTIHPSRLEERIEALLNHSESYNSAEESISYRYWWSLLALFPLLAIFLHS